MTSTKIEVTIIVQDPNHLEKIKCLQHSLIIKYPRVVQDFDFTGPCSDYNNRINQLDVQTRLKIISGEFQEVAVAELVFKQIFIYNKFWSQPIDKQFIILLHELGHIKNPIDLSAFSTNLEPTLGKGLGEHLAEQYILNVDSNLAIQNLQGRCENIGDGLLLQFISYYPLDLGKNEEAVKRFEELFRKLFGDEYEIINCAVRDFLKFEGINRAVPGCLNDYHKKIRDLDDKLNGTKFGKFISNFS